MRLSFRPVATSLLLAPGRICGGVGGTIPLWLACCVALALIFGGCSTDGEGPKDTGGGGGQTDTVEDQAVGSDAETDSGQPDTTGSDSAEPDTTDAGSDVADAGADVPDTTEVPCNNDAYCKTALAGTLKPCQTAVCDLGTGKCKAVQKSGTCCTDVDCNDGAECTIDKCDLASNVCEHKAKPNCCAGQQTLLDVGFEQNAFESFNATEGSSNGNVKWQLTTNRSHTGKSALYLGNACKTYDNSMLETNGCAAGGNPKAVVSKLNSAEVIIPAGKQALAHFWIWIAAEKMFADALPVGQCPQGCPKGASCVKLLPDPGDLCLPENDVMRVFVDAAGATGGDPVWVSTEVKKSTNGWHHVSINLAQFQKSGSDTAIKLRWEFTANDVQNEHEGVYLDDVTIETLCANDDTLCDLHKTCKADGNPCTADSCTYFVNDKAQGLCFHQQTPGCCVTAGDCNDKNDCSVDACGKDEGAAQGTCNHSPDASNPACCQTASLAADNFDGGSISTWQHLGANSKSVVWQLSTKQFKSGKASLFFGNAANDGYDDPVLGNAKGPKGTICGKPTKLMAGTVYNNASFQLKMKTEWSGQPKANYKNPPAPDKSTVKLDELRVEVLEPTGLKTIWSSDAVFGTTDDQWVPVIVPLDKYSGQSVSVCFTFDTGDGLGNTLGGIWIDDFAVDVACTKQVCITNEQCAAECGTCGIPTCDSGACKCEKKPNCCTGNADCDDSDKCSSDSCVEGVCKHTVSDPKCCSDKTGANALYGEGFEKSNGKLPAGWKASKLSGQAPFGGAPYDQNIVWNVSPLQQKGGAYSLCFADINGFINGGANVPAGKALSPAFKVPTNGSVVVNFDLRLSTEWDDFPFKAFDFAVDQLVLYVVDTAEADAKKARTLIWDSYTIGGSTKKQWRNVVAAIPEKLAGKDVRLEFFFDSGNPNNNNTYNGACIDNIAVETWCVKPACIADSDCAPQTPDTCKSYVCSKADGKFSCATAAKGGEGCCTPLVPLPAENGEGGSLVKWTGTSTSASAKWQVIGHKYLNGLKEVYFGDAGALNYATGSKKTCNLDTDCASGEKCAGSIGKKICGTPVAAELTSDAFKLSQDANKGAQLRFKMYLDIEPTFETFQIWVTGQDGNDKQKIWDRDNVADMGTSQYKLVVEKVVDIKAFKTGEDIRLRFKFDSVDSSKNQLFQGIFLDEIVVEEPCKD